jgi:hypothetical protein
MASQKASRLHPYQSGKSSDRAESDRNSSDVFTADRLISTDGRRSSTLESRGLLTKDTADSPGTSDWRGVGGSAALSGHSIASNPCHLSRSWCGDPARGGRDDTQPERQRHQCRACRQRFDDLTETIFAGRHRPLRVWILCPDFMGLNLSDEQTARELEIDPEDARVMASRLREGIVARKPEV